MTELGPPDLRGMSEVEESGRANFEWSLQDMEATWRLGTVCSRLARLRMLPRRAGINPTNG